MRLARTISVVAVAGVLFVAACGDGDGSGAGGGSRADATTTIAVTEAMPVLRPAEGDVGARAMVAGVVTVPGGFLAIGERFDDDGGGGDIATSTTFWRSTDGRSWTMSDADPAVWAGWTVDKVAQGAAGIVVLVGGDQGRAIASSVDGETWTMTPITPSTIGLPGDTFPGAFPINDVAAVDAGFLALGQLVGGVSGAAPTVEPLLLVSPDGASWQRATGPALAPTDAPPEYFAGTGVLGGTSYAVLTSGDLFNVSVWRSIDTTTWEPVGGTELFGGVDHVAVATATSFDGRLIVGGHDHTSGATAVWTSDDGETWTLASGAGLAGPGRFAPERFVTRDGELLMIGTREPASDGNMTGTAWASGDGITWRRQPDDSAVTGRVDVAGAASTGADVAVVGAEYPGAVDLATIRMGAWWIDEVEG
jgi:hypothetical protein